MQRWGGGGEAGASVDRQVAMSCYVYCQVILHIYPGRLLWMLLGTKYAYAGLGLSLHLGM